MQNFGLTPLFQGQGWPYNLRPGGLCRKNHFCEKHKNASIYLTVRDRAILSKFLTHRVFNQYTNFQKMSSFQKWQPFLIFEFWNIMFLSGDTSHFVADF